MPYKLDVENKIVLYYTDDVAPENGVEVTDSFNPAVIDFTLIAAKAYERLMELNSKRSSLTLSDKKNYFAKIFNSILAIELEQIKEL